MKFGDKGFTLETIHSWWLKISQKKKTFCMDLHVKAYHFNQWLLSLYAFKYLYCSITLSSRGWNWYFSVYSDLNLYKHILCIPTPLPAPAPHPFHLSFIGLIISELWQLWSLRNDGWIAEECSLVNGYLTDLPKCLTVWCPIWCLCFHLICSS